MIRIRIFNYHKAKLCLTIIITTSIMYVFLQTIAIHNVVYREQNVIAIEAEHEDQNVKEWIDSRTNLKNLSKLGRILFMGDNPPTIQGNQQHQILLWKYGPTIEKRLMKHYTKDRIDPFRHCSVSNCDITYDDSALNTADLVIFHLHRTKSLKELPGKRGKEGQIWAFLTDESPYHTFMGRNTLTDQGKKINITNFNGIFNWSMSYRHDSDIPVPYGRTVLKNNLTNAWINMKRRDVLAAIMISNCRAPNNRLEYVKELQNFMKVDVYGNCGPLKCPGHYSKDCPLLDDYLFYLSFENSNCEEYITEKLWWNAFNKNAIPVIMGGSTESYKMLLPPKSFVHVDDFANPASLAQFLLRLNKTGEYMNYYGWKYNFEVLNEHGYFQSDVFHYCRACEALNYNDRSPKVYTNLEETWDYNKVCRPAWNSD
ncbi:unnamed protein product [Phyllotreta striolata]|uniref:Fucosyltransferase n=1 Tax=Phyllotreta striolata TaxID=444603 RepID=A0A9N9TR56_PHYSR|nr:unnamed protein product [Phyllotreta striolata]